MSAKLMLSKLCDYLNFDVSEPPVVGAELGLELGELGAGAGHHQTVLLVELERGPEYNTNILRVSLPNKCIWIYGVPQHP